MNRFIKIRLHYFTLLLSCKILFFCFGGFIFFSFHFLGVSHSASWRIGSGCRFNLFILTLWCDYKKDFRLHPSRFFYYFHFHLFFNYSLPQVFQALCQNSILTLVKKSKNASFLTVSCNQLISGCFYFVSGDKKNELYFSRANMETLF